MSFKVKKENGALIVKDNGGYETRNSSTIWCLNQADKIYNWKDFKEIVISTGDIESGKDDFTYSKTGSYNNLIPDFNFHAWPEVGINDYEELISNIDKAGQTKSLVNKVGWIGNSTTNPMRKILLDIGKNNKELFDFFDMRWFPSGKTRLNSTSYISTPDLVRIYSILIDIEGVGYSGRLKHLLWSHRPVLLVDRPHKEYFYEFMKEWEHFIPVKRDLSDLVEKTKWCLVNYNKACEIAENAYAFAKQYLTRDACYAQWNKVITNIK